MASSTIEEEPGAWVVWAETGAGKLEDNHASQFFSSMKRYCVN